MMMNVTDTLFSILSVSSKSQINDNDSNNNDHDYYFQNIFSISRDSCQLSVHSFMAIYRMPVEYNDSFFLDKITRKRRKKKKLMNDYFIFWKFLI